MESRVIDRRTLLGLLTALGAWASETLLALRGKLSPGPKLVTPDGKSISLTGDKATMAVLNDARLKDMEVEATGEALAMGEFKIGPIHKKSMFVIRDGKKLQISYWCAVCSIRTYTPGVCMCCQDETELDLKESFQP